MSESPLNWQTFSTGEWNEYLEEHGQSAISDSKQIMANSASLLEAALKKNEKPNTIVDWLRLICFVQSKNNILTSSSEKEKRLKIFSLKDTIQLPLECLGANAQRFISTAKQNFKYGSWAPPLRPELVYTLYTLFDQLDSDILDDPEWEVFWTEQQHIILSGLEGVSNHDSDKYFSLLKLEVLSAYRSLVIKNTEYLSSDDEEDDDEHAMKESRVVEYFESINYLKNSSDAKTCYNSLYNTYNKTVNDHVLKAMMKAKGNLLDGGSITKTVDFIRREIIECRSLSAYSLLPLEKAESSVQTLVSLKHDYLEIMSIIDGHLDSIANQFVPSFDQDSGVRVLNLILQAREAILAADVFEKRQEVGKITLKKYLGSTEAITRTYKLALAARVEYFSQYLPHDINKLINNEVCGIRWIRYPRARREVLAQLFDEILTNANKYPHPPIWKRLLGVKTSPEQTDALLKIQEAYLDAYKKDLGACLPAEAEKLLLLAQTDKILSPISNKIFSKRCIGAPEEMMKTLSVIVKENCQSDNTTTDVSLYDSEAPPEHDVTYGLFYELSQMLDEHQDKDTITVQEIDCDKTKSEILNEKIIPFPRDINSVDMPIEDLLYNKIQHAVLGVRLNSIINPEERLEKINYLFKRITCPDNIHRHSKGLGRLLQHKYNATQKSAIVTLQTCYIQALQEAWVLKAQSYHPTSHPQELPASLDITQKNQIFMEYMRTARKSKIMNCEVSLGSVDQLHFQIHRMIMALNNIPESDLCITNIG